MKYIDIHAHVFPENIAAKAVDQLENYYHMKWQGNGTLSDLLQSMDKNKISRTVIFSTATKPAQVPVIHDFISGLCRQDSRLIGFGTMHPNYPEIEAEFERMCDLGLCGVKFHPDFQMIAIDDPRMIPIYRMIGDRVPVLIHMGDKNTDLSAPVRLARVLDLIPELTVIAAHFGGYSAWDEARKHLIGRNCYLDCSSSFPFLSYAEAEQIIRRHGIDKILFASDYPALLHDHAINDVRKMNFSETEYEKIFYRNAAKLLKIEI